MSLKDKTLTEKVTEALGFVYDDKTVSPFCTYENLQKILPFLAEAEVEIRRLNEDISGLVDESIRQKKRAIRAENKLEAVRKFVENHPSLEDGVITEVWRFKEWIKQLEGVVTSCVERNLKGNTTKKE